MKATQLKILCKERKLKEGKRAKETEGDFIASVHCPTC
jgi:hypothetical protein